MANQNTNLDLGLKNNTNADSAKNSVLRLETALTQSAFGHEYALLLLDEGSTSFSNRQELFNEMEEHKKVYFWAREQLSQLDPHRLSEIEADLKAQKEAILRNKLTLH